MLVVRGVSSIVRDWMNLLVDIDEAGRVASLATLGKRIRRLSPPHQATLKFLSQHLARFGLKLRVCAPLIV
jgi:hypothetical protein